MFKIDLAGNLLKATDLDPTLLERRSISRKRVKRDRRRGITRTVGLNVTPSGISLAVYEQSGDKPRLIVDHVKFPDGHGPATGDWSDDTLANALCEIASTYNLGGQPVIVGLGGDPCVTRVVAGDNDHVDNEITELTGRTQRYIGMGIGEKVSCETVNRIDAKRKRVCVTIAVREVVDAVAHAVQAAGMRLAHMEHTMLILCRILHTYQKDSDEPVLIIVDEMGRIDLGISYQGRLLLDYRPAMPDSKVTDASVVKRHWKCLRRYIQAQLPDASGDLTTVFMTGKESEIQSDDNDSGRESVRSSSIEQSVLFDQVRAGSDGDVGESGNELCDAKPHDVDANLTWCQFPLADLCEGVELVGEAVEQAGMLTAIALARQTDQRGGTEDKNDLVSTLRTTNRVQWLPFLGHLWPFAVAASIGMLLLLLGNAAEKQASRRENQIEELATQSMEGNQIRLVLQRQKQRRQQVDSLARSIQKPRWARVFWEAGMSLPEGAWLESIYVDRDSTTKIVGAGHANDSVYEYIQKLRESRVFSRVALESTSTTRGGLGPEYRFEISATIDVNILNENEKLAGNTLRGDNRG